MRFIVPPRPRSRPSCAASPSTTRARSASSASARARSTRPCWPPPVPGGRNRRKNSTPMSRAASPCGGSVSRSMSRKPRRFCSATSPATLTARRSCSTAGRWLCRRGDFMPTSPRPLPKIEHPLQLGGIRTGSLDAPGAGGSPGVRVALVDTGSGLRFTVALDRGGDVIDASFNDCALAYLSPNGLTPPNAAFHRDNEWLRNWPGGLVTTCGPEYIGGSRTEDGTVTTLHGRFSNTPATGVSVTNPDPRQGRMEMALAFSIRVTRVFGPNFEIRRRLSCTLGRPEVVIEDEVENIGDSTAAHHWLYHCNFGYPLLDEGARFVYRGRARYWIAPPPSGEDIVQPLSAVAMNRLKRVPKPLSE